MNKKTTILPVYGMKCSKCVARVTAILEAFPQVDTCVVSLPDAIAEISTEGEHIPLTEIRLQLEEAGFTCDPPGESSRSTPSQVSVQQGGVSAANQAQQLRFAINGMHCASCAATIEKRVKDLPGVVGIAVNLAGNFAQVSYDPAKIAVDDIYNGVDAAGFKAVRDGSDSDDLSTKELRLVLLAAACALPIMLFMYVPMFGQKTIAVNGLLASIAQFTAGAGFYVSAVKSLRNRSANMDVLVALGITAAYGYSILAFTGILGSDATIFFETSAMLILFIRFGKWLEARAKGRASSALKQLLQLQPDSAVLLEEGVERIVAVETLKPGDVVIVRAGEKIPVDGEVIQGSAAIDEAMITGEAVPVDKMPGNKVIGATMNRSGMIHVRVTNVGQEAVLAQIVRMVEAAQGDKPPIQRLADRISGFFVPIVVLLAFVTLSCWLIVGYDFLFAFKMAVAVVVVACPCALGLATPTAIMVGSSVGLELGLLFKRASVLEQISSLQVLLLDKTGTLTTGQFKIERIIKTSSLDENEILVRAATLESASSHPLAQAIVAEAGDRQLSFDTAVQNEEVGGHGIVGYIDGEMLLCGNRSLMQKYHINLKTSDLEAIPSGSSTIFVAVAGALQGIICLADEIKPDAPQFIADIKQLGILPVMVTGDRVSAAQRVAEALCLEQFEAEVLPENKLEVVTRYQQRGLTVGMVGDGINDAPALAQADIGIAIGSGTDVAKETGDLVIVGDQLRDINRGILLGRRTLAKIKQNLFWAFFYNLLGIPLAAGLFFPLFGLALKPEYAGLAMAFSSVSVVSNSLLLRRVKLKLQQV